MNKVKKLLRTIFLVEIAQGMALTLKTMLTPQKNFPKTRSPGSIRRSSANRSRARAGFMPCAATKRAQGGCIGCGLCEAVCPSKAITVVTSEGPDHEKAGELL